jgi:hypothetical protein
MGEWIGLALPCCTKKSADWAFLRKIDGHMWKEPGRTGAGKARLISQQNSSVNVEHYIMYCWTTKLKGSDGQK